MRLFSYPLAIVLLVLTGAQSSSAQDVRTGYMVHRDFSDCQNNDVSEPADPSTMNGAVLVGRASDGKTNIKIAITARANTTYHFFLKCVKFLADVKTDDDGIAVVELSFNTNEAGNVFAFDMYPEGAPAGNKFQSTQIKF